MLSSSRFQGSLEESRGDGNRPPLDEKPLVGPPPTAWRNFKRAKLRQFPQAGQEIHWLAYLGHGEDGLVFSATIGDSQLVRAIKVFWDTRRPATQDGRRPSEWSFEEGARNHALVENMRWAMQHAEADPDRPILVKKGPKTRAEAIDNFFAYSDEGRQADPATYQDGTWAPASPFPAMLQCYGWMRIERHQIPDLEPPVWRLVESTQTWYWALVNELVPIAEENMAVTQAHLSFFHEVGFALDQGHQPLNWRGGKLVDLNDILSPFAFYWKDYAVLPYTAEPFCQAGVPAFRYKRKIVPRTRPVEEEPRRAEGGEEG